MKKLILALLFVAGITTSYAGGLMMLHVGSADGSGSDAQLNLNLVANTGNVPPSSALTVTRSGSAFVQNTSGALSTIGANALRLGADEIFNAATGVWIEEAATNGVADPSYSNANALPTGWTFVSSPAVTATFTKTGTGTGTLRLQGTATGDVFLQFGAANSFAVVPGDVLTASLKWQLASGTFTNVTNLTKLIVEYTVGLGINVLGSQVTQALQSDIPWFDQYIVTASASSAFAQSGIHYAASGAYDFTLQIDTPQLEKRAWRSTFAASTRNADQVNLASSYQTAYLGSANRTACIGFTAPRQVAAGTIWSEQLDANNYIALNSTGSFGSSSISLFVKSAGVTTANVSLGVVAPLSTNKLCMAVSGSAISISLNGKAAVSTALTPPSALTSALLLSGQNGYLNSSVQTLVTWLRTLNGAELATNTSISSDIFDDFDRADNASLGSATTGQAWSQTGSPVFAIASKFMTNNSTAANGTYGLITLARVPIYAGSVVKFANQPNSPGVALVASDSAPTINSIANHQVWSLTQNDFGYLPGSNTPLVAVLSYLYPLAFVKDGLTLMGFGWGVRNFDTSIVGIQADGALIRQVSSAITSRTGSVMWYETACVAASCATPFFKSVSAR